jgi:type VI secretion system secreted protein VgrG
MAGEDSTRKIRLVAPDEVGPFLVARFSGTEGLGRLFEYDVELLSLDLAVKFDSIIGKPVTIIMDADAHGPERIVNGYVSRFSQVDRQVRYMKYVATVVPYLWFLNRTADCRIMPTMKTVPQIVRQVLADRGFTDVDDSGLDTAAYKPRTYCVQYRETDFNFIARLLEEEGIYYFFDHQRVGTGGGTFKHMLVLCDSTTKHKMGAGCDALHQSKQRDDSIDAIADWTVMNHAHADESFLMDYDFETREVLRVHGQAVYGKLSTKADEVQFTSPVRGEIADFPAGFHEGHKAADREHLASTRAEQSALRRTVHRGFTTAHGLFPGVTFKVDGHPRPDQNGTYLVISSSHTGWESLGESGEETAEGEPYTVAFEAIDAERHYRPLRTTLKPIIAGPQTALVVGDQNNEAFTDEYGRVRVKFHWDSTKKKAAADDPDETMSCLIRVAQIWAGNRWGAMFMPRVGHEVVVEFLEGDPDRPLITGRVYNGMAMPPYDPGKHASVATIKSMTTTKDGHGCNELRFEDKKGSEQLFIHAEKNQDNRVKNDALEWVGNNRHQVVQQNMYQKIGGALHTAVTGDQNVKVDGTASLNAGKDMQLKAAMKYGLDAGTDVHIKAGANLVIEAGASITLKAGGGFIVIGPASVAVSGTPILLNSGGSAGSGAGSSPTAPEAPTDADAGG